jgi:hypothetical protein
MVFFVAAPNGESAFNGWFLFVEAAQPMSVDKEVEDV